jgi:DNA-directed RNA polymerase omega subunit
MQKIPESIGSKYRFIIIAAERAKQLQSSARPKVKTKSTKPAFVAMREVEEGLVKFEIPKAEEPPPQNQS